MDSFKHQYPGISKDIFFTPAKKSPIEPWELSISISFIKQDYATLLNPPSEFPGGLECERHTSENQFPGAVIQYGT